MNEISFKNSRRASFHDTPLSVNNIPPAPPDDPERRLSTFRQPNRAILSPTPMHHPTNAYVAVTVANNAENIICR